MRRRAAALAGLALVTAGGLVWLLTRWEPPTGPSVVLAGPAASAPLQASAPASGASFALAQPSASSVAEAAEQDLASRMKENWCVFGAAAARQTRQVARARGAEPAEAKAHAARLAAVGVRVLDEAREQATQRFVRALQARRDQRSLALAEYLLGDAPARARLQDLAGRSTDPMVTALALQRLCDAGDCINIEASQWSRLEPANLQAWLTLMQKVPNGGLSWDEAWDRVLGVARYSRSYQRETLAALLALPLTLAPGLASQAELEVLTGLNAAWVVPKYSWLLGGCRLVRRDAPRAARCSAVAELMWSQDSLLERSVALATVRTLMRDAPALRAAWEPRASQYAIVTAGAEDGLQRLMARVWPQGGAAAAPAACGELSALRSLLVAMAGRGEWMQAIHDLREAGQGGAGEFLEGSRNALERPARQASTGTD